RLALHVGGRLLHGGEESLKRLLGLLDAALGHVAHLGGNFEARHRVLGHLFAPWLASRHPAFFSFTSNMPRRAHGFPSAVKVIPGRDRSFGASGVDAILSAD